MKVLAIAKPKEALLSVPPETRAQYLKESTELTKKMIESGKSLAGYYCPTSGYVFTVLNYDSTEEWMKDLSSTQVFDYYDQDVYPVVDMMEALEAAGTT